MSERPEITSFQDLLDLKKSIEDQIDQHIENKINELHEALKDLSQEDRKPYIQTAVILAKGGSIICHADDEHLFIDTKIPYVVDRAGFVELGKPVAFKGGYLAKNGGLNVEI